MKNAVVIYQSKGGTTKKLGSKIALAISQKGLSTEVMSVEDCRTKDLSTFDYIFLGCWTKGLMFFAQHPDAVWKKLVSNLSLSDKPCVGFFTTYKIATGTMFRKMRSALPAKPAKNAPEIKSRNGDLTEKSRQLIDQFVM